MFQHKSFGSGMRNMLLEKKKVGWHEMNEEWEERVRVISDLYCEKQEEDEGWMSQLQSDLMKMLSKKKKANCQMWWSEVIECYWIV